ncbi:carbonyl reductase [NADPH] 2-like [Ruditapes philippinarum]|uniref:carbonyl reductase [NADPH] 2-like n=1 Tax=Ruditapes philippinarum TaxID=129788 RepID=UPI00295A9724|nr:carbonyl reductase [NADPH] 2-like [Ruditapes philippinarum]
MSLNLSGKKFLVTGAGRGIGRAVTKALCEQGCKVYALSRSKGPLDSLAAECPNVEIIQADVGNWDELKEKIEKIETLDGLVNNAAFSDEATLSSLEVSNKYLQKIFAVNLFGSINATQIVAKKMIADGRPGSIVNVSSIFALQAAPGYLAYTVSKAGMDMVTKQFALELGPHNIRVNSVNPTLVMTEASKNFIAQGHPIEKLFLERTPMPRIPEEEEIAAPILYFLSDMSSMVSGTIHIIDGGLTSSFSTKM